MPFLLIRDDITKVRADAIVNPANTSLEEGRGTSRGIYVAAGKEKLREACQRIGRCDEGKAVITDGFDLPARYIIHAVGPVWQGGGYGEDRILYNTYMESMALAREKGLESIAFPLLSSGNCGFPKTRAMRIAVSAIKDYIKFHDMTVYLVVYDGKSLAISQKLFKSIEEYIDEHYVENNNEDFHSTTNLSQSQRSQRQEKSLAGKKKEKKKFPWLSLFRKKKKGQDTGTLGEDLENTGSLPPLPYQEEPLPGQDLEDTAKIPPLPSFTEEEQERVPSPPPLPNLAPPVPPSGFSREPAVFPGESETGSSVPPPGSPGGPSVPPPGSFRGPSVPPPGSPGGPSEPLPGSFRGPSVPPPGSAGGPPEPLPGSSRGPLAPPPASSGPPPASFPPRKKERDRKASEKSPRAPILPRFLSSKEKKRRLEDIMTHMGETFSQMLIRLIDERGLTDPEVYHKANIDRKLFSKIRNNKEYSPNKKTIIAFAIALELSLDETRDLLRTAGYSLSDSSRFDVIIRFFQENQIYDIFEINEMLFLYEQPVLGSA